VERTRQIEEELRRVGGAARLRFDLHRAIPSERLLVALLERQLGPGAFELERDAWIFPVKGKPCLRG